MRKEGPILRNCYSCKFWRPDEKTEAKRAEEFKGGNITAPPRPEGFCSAAKKIDVVILHNGDLNRFPAHHTTPQSACNAIRAFGIGPYAHTPHKAIVEYLKKSEGK